MANIDCSGFSRLLAALAAWIRDGEGAIDGCVELGCPCLWLTGTLLLERGAAGLGVFSLR